MTKLTTDERIEKHFTDREFLCLTRDDGRVPEDILTIDEAQSFRKIWKDYCLARIENGISTIPSSAYASLADKLNQISTLLLIFSEAESTRHWVCVKEHELRFILFSRKAPGADADESVLTVDEVQSLRKDWQDFNSAWGKGGVPNIPTETLRNLAEKAKQLSMLLSIFPETESTCDWVRGKKDWLINVLDSRRFNMPLYSEWFKTQEV